MKAFEYVKKKKMFLIKTVVLLFLAQIVACDIETQDKKIYNQAVHGNKLFELKNGEIQDLIAKANNGDGDAALRLNKYYDLIKKDREKGLLWLKKAAESGNMVGQHNLAKRYLRDKNNKTALYWFNEAAKRGDEDSKKYVELLKVEVDIKQLTKQGNNGDADAAYLLHRYYYYIEGDQERDLSWLVKAAESGHVEAQYELSQRTEDKEKAIYWRNKAAEGGHIKAKEILNLQREKKQH